MATPRTRKKPTRNRSTEDKSSQLIDYVETLASLNEHDPICNSDPLPTVEMKLEKTLDEKLVDISTNVELQLEQFLLNLDLKLQGLFAQLPINPPCTSCSPSANEFTEINSEESDDRCSDDFDQDDYDPLLSDWDRRKQQMLAEYGMSGDEIAEQTIAVNASFKKSFSKKTHATSTNSSTSGKGVKLSDDDRQPPRLGGCEEGHALEALHDSIAQLDKIDSIEIEALKEQLTSKLRDAEVELSINRAKLSQQWAALEQKQCEMTQREAALKSKYGNLTEATKKAGLLDRLSRHLTRRNDDSA